MIAARLRQWQGEQERWDRPEGYFRINGQDFVSGLEEAEEICLFLKFLFWLTWEMVILLTERGETGVTGLYGRDNQFGCGNFGLKVVWGNLVVATL